ncbi:aminoglycoside phosphotransferase family protein [Sphingorhabdus sp. M41]|uniref:aminoglycoside phosphotransferase family protein n=1 Tax=Sphingorhabdus sp. M41 TaxID=1806885 RepID=UPI00078B17BD|nr:phosphotransferase [Sphingorhabdus sp. M41]AMO73271.1 aminoglycoside phosphotransferase [Sphingorhabdus sp. M41]
MKPPAAAAEFLTQYGWRDAELSPVAGDASFRRYFRVRDGDRRAILMDAPPPHEDPKPFIAIAEYLVGAGFAAPEIFARDLDQGLVLLEDFGDQRMREHLDDHPQDEDAIYRRVIDLLRDLHKAPAAALPPYDEAQYLREANLLTEWYCPAQQLDVDAEGFEAIWRGILAPVIAAQYPPVTVMRDYHAENIMLLDDGRLGLLDFQDALMGHPAYDLVSMLQDARRDVPDELEENMLAYYLAGHDQDAADEFRRHYAILGAQRNTKIIGIFTRLCMRDGKARYLDFLPRMWRLLEKDLRHPALQPMAEWFGRNIPHEVRSRPMPAAKAAQ